MACRSYTNDIDNLKLIVQPAKSGHVASSPNAFQQFIPFAGKLGIAAQRCNRLMQPPLPPHRRSTTTFDPYERTSGARGSARRGSHALPATPGPFQPFNKPPLPTTHPSQRPPYMQRGCGAA